MTGRDLIIYIMKNNLEDEEVFKDGKFIGFLTDVEVAVKLNVSVATIRALYTMEKLSGFKIGETIYISDALE